MRGDDDILELLNDVLTGELTAINQYFVHAKMCDNWGYRRLGEKVRDESIDEMKHAEALVERILYLEGVPNLQRLGTLRIGETVLEQFESTWPSSRPRSSASGTASPCASPRATTAAASCSRGSSPTRRSTSTGWRGSWRPSIRSARALPPPAVSPPAPRLLRRAVPPRGTPAPARPRPTKPRRKGPAGGGLTPRLGCGIV